MRSKARRLKADVGRRAWSIVDYLQLMQGPANSENRQQEISQISRALKALAKELNVPVVALSQLSRAPEQRTGDNKRPQLSDLRESGAIEQDADLVMFIYRQEFYDGPMDKDGNSLEGKAEVIVGKQRNGPTGIVNLFFHKQYTRFESYNRSDIAVISVCRHDALVPTLNQSSIERELREPRSRSRRCKSMMPRALGCLAPASCRPLAFAHGQDQDRVPLHRVRRRALALAGPLRRVRRVEHARRRDRRAEAGERRAARPGASAARDRSPTAGASRSTPQRARRERLDHGALEDRASTSSISSSAAASCRAR